MKLRLICCVLILVLLLSSQDAVRLYKTREEVLNLLGGGELSEERLYMEFCHQSSATGNCMLAIDTFNLNEWTQCSATEPEDRGWWKAQMETPSYIIRVVIDTVELPSIKLNDALLDFSIFASDYACYRHRSSVSFTSKSFPCDALADQLVIQSHRANAVLSLCEIIPYGIPVSFQGIEVSEMEVMVSHCDQSSVLGGNDCYYALDRHFETNPSAENGKQCAESLYHDESFWVAYFPLPTLVKFVKIFQSTKEYVALRNFHIKVNGLICNKYKTDKDFVARVFQCQRFGNNVMIQAFKYDAFGTRFSICQVQIFGHEMAIRKDVENKYIGCFNDDPEKPDLDLMVAYTWMSPTKCHRLCKRANKKFFGLQNGQVCMCGDKYGRYGEVGDTDYGNSTVSTETADSAEPCSIPCKAASEHKCGGPYQNSVYEIIV